MTTFAEDQIEAQRRADADREKVVMVHFWIVTIEITLVILGVGFVMFGVWWIL